MYTRRSFQKTYMIILKKALLYLVVHVTNLSLEPLLRFIFYLLFGLWGGLEWCVYGGKEGNRMNEYFWRDNILGFMETDTVYNLSGKSK